MRSAQIGGTTAEARKIAETRFDIVKLLIERGAKTRAEISTSAGERLTAKVALQEAFGGWVDEESLRRSMELLDARSIGPGIRGLPKQNIEATTRLIKHE